METGKLCVFKYTSEDKTKSFNKHGLANADT